MTGRTLRYSSVKISLLLLTIFTLINIYIHQKNVHINFEKETAENSQNELKRMMGRIRNGKIHFSINFTHPRPYKKLKIRKEINIAEEIVEEVGRDDKFEKCPQRGIPQGYRLLSVMSNKLFLVFSRKNDGEHHEIQLAPIGGPLRPTMSP